MRMSCASEKVFGIVIWTDAVCDCVLVTCLFLGRDQLTVRNPNEGMKPEGRTDQGCEEADEWVSTLNVSRFVKQSGLKSTNWPSGAVVRKQNVRTYDAAGEWGRRRLCEG